MHTMCIEKRMQRDNGTLWDRIYEGFIIVRKIYSISFMNKKLDVKISFSEENIKHSRPH